MTTWRRWRGKEADSRFSELPWDEETPRWQEIDQCLPADHLARQIDEAVEELDLAELFGTYAGRGSKALRPDRLFRLVLYETQRGRLSPAQWYFDAKENEPAQWLLFGLTPSRAALYEFRERLQKLWDGWHEQVMQKAQELGIPVGERVALDGTLIAALASRHRLVNQKTLTTRSEELQRAVAADQQGQPPDPQRFWMAKHPDTRKRQLEGYRAAQTRMQQLQAENQKRRSSKRKKPEKIVVSVSDPGAVVGRDKLKVFRPLYNAQLMYDLDSDFITAYDVFACQNDAGTIGRMLERCVELVGRKPQVVLADAGYAGGPDVAVCEQAGVTLYAPVSENDFSEAKQSKQKFPQIPKKDFTWLPEEQTYRCPEGHQLIPGRTTSLARSNDRTVLQTIYRCPREHCMQCPRREACTPSAGAGRTVSRLEHEDLLEKLRDRMATPEAKELYKLRHQTVELCYADLKEHRKMRRFHSYGLRRAHGEIGAAVLAYNLLILVRHSTLAATSSEPMRIPEEVPS
jgi:transposase